MKTERIQKQCNKVVLEMRRLWELLMREVCQSVLIDLLNCDFDNPKSVYGLYVKASQSVERTVLGSGCIENIGPYTLMPLDDFMLYYDDGQRAFAHKMRDIIKQCIQKPPSGCSWYSHEMMEMLNSLCGPVPSDSGRLHRLAIIGLHCGILACEDSVESFLPKIQVGCLCAVNSWLSFAAIGAALIDLGTIERCAEKGCKTFFIREPRGIRQRFCRSSCRISSHRRKRAAEGL